MKTLLVPFVLVLSAASRAPEPAPSLVGTWSVTMIANYSTCDNARVGQEKAEQWVFNVEGDRVTVSVVGNRTADSHTDDVYEGTHFPGEGVTLFDGPRAGIELAFTPAGELVGRRVIASPLLDVEKRGLFHNKKLTGATACAIIYDVKARKL